MRSSRCKVYTTTTLNVLKPQFLFKTKSFKTHIKVQISRITELPCCSPSSVIVDFQVELCLSSNLKGLMCIHKVFLFSPDNQEASYPLGIQPGGAASLRLSVNLTVMFLCLYADEEDHQGKSWNSANNVLRVHCKF